LRLTGASRCVVRVASNELAPAFYDHDVSDIRPQWIEDEDADWYPDVTDDSLRPRYTKSGIQYYVQPNGVIWLTTATLPDDAGE
jgi:hypothetical protein